jgi:hypothetical protein
MRSLKLMANPDVSFASAGLESWVLRRYPSMAKLVLQEWFFNCLKAMRNGRNPITIGVEDRALTVRSAGYLSDQDFRAITGKPSKGKLKADAHGLVLIRDIAYYAFGKRVQVQQGGGSIRLSISLPLAQRARNDNA